jgi:predicted P-loop ATPase
MQRAYDPGCLVYGCLVLEGEQGTGKSYGLSVIGGEYYSDNMPQMNDTRGVVELLGDKWILEISELAAMKKSEVEMVKAFLTRTHDRARMAYARTVSMHPRSCVFAGSTNDSSYLEDTTGNRRFWPVTIGRLGFRELEKARDALLAEARDVYKWQKGEGTLKTWLPDSLLRDQVAKTAERMTVDPFVFEIEEFAKGRDAEDGGVSVRDILTNCLSIPLGQQSQTHSRRVCRALAFLGYEKKVEGQGRGGGAKVKWTKAGSF